MVSAKFRIGRVVVTKGAMSAIEDGGQNLQHLLNQHTSGIWGQLHEADRLANATAIAHEGDLERQGHVFSSFRAAAHVEIWIITKWDRSLTTVFVPENC
jgi:hypothetical protein